MRERLQLSYDETLQILSPDVDMDKIIFTMFSPEGSLVELKEPVRFHASDNLGYWSIDINKSSEFVGCVLALKTDKKDWASVVLVPNPETQDLPTEFLSMSVGLALMFQLLEKRGFKCVVGTIEANDRYSRESWFQAQNIFEHRYYDVHVSRAGNDLPPTNYTICAFFGKEFGGGI